MWQSDTPVGGTTSFSAWGYWLETPDGATHTLTGNPNTVDATGEPTSFDSNDTSGFHVDLTNPDTNGIPVTALVRDRTGNIYQFNGFDGRCSFWPRSDPSAMPAYSLTPSVHNYGSDLVRTCTQQSFAQTITDANGNVFNTGVGSSASDTMGRTTVVTSSSSDYSGCAGTPSSATVFTFAGIAGASPQLKLCNSSLNLATSFNATDGAGNTIGEFASTPASLSTTVLLPDQTSYTFSYDSYGMITGIGLPTGGSISYTWVTISLPACGTVPVSRAVASRTMNDGLGHSYTWNYHYGTVVNGVLTNTVTDPLGNDSVHTFTGLDPAGCRLYETSTKYYQGSSSSGQLLKRVDTHYTFANLVDESGGGGVAGNVVSDWVQTTAYPSGRVSLQTNTFDPPQPVTGVIFGQHITEKAYDWGAGAPGALLREKDTSYLWQTNSVYLAAHLLDLPASVIVKDGNGNRVAETDSTYDEATYLTSYAATLPAGTHVAAPNSVRGNLTTVNHWLNTNNSWITGHANWYDTGEVYKQIDPLANATTHSYDPAYGGAYSTQTCNALSQCVSGTYDFDTGLITSFTDANAATQASGATPGDAAHTSNYSYERYRDRLL